MLMLRLLILVFPVSLVSNWHTPCPTGCAHGSCSVVLSMRNMYVFVLLCAVYSFSLVISLPQFVMAWDIVLRHTPSPLMGSGVDNCLFVVV